MPKKIQGCRAIAHTQSIHDVALVWDVILKGIPPENIINRNFALILVVAARIGARKAEEKRSNSVCLFLYNVGSSVLDGRSLCLYLLWNKVLYSKTCICSFVSTTVLHTRKIFLYDCHFIFYATLYALCVWKNKWLNNSSVNSCGCHNKPSWAEPSLVNSTGSRFLNRTGAEIGY